MLGSLFRPLQAACLSMRVRKVYPYSRYLADLPDKDFDDRTYCSKFLERRIHKHSIKSQKGLFDGKENKSGNVYCYSDKHKRRRFRVNSQKKVFYSHILGTSVDVLTSMHASRTIRKFGGFDNYILLREEHKMQSIYGEYLREMMLRKLNDPQFKVKEVYKDPVYQVKLKRKGKRFLKYDKRYKQFRWLPADIRHTDLSHLHELDEEQIPLKDRRKVASADASTKRSNINS